MQTRSITPLPYSTVQPMIGNKTTSLRDQPTTPGTSSKQILTNPSLQFSKDSKLNENYENFDKIDIISKNISQHSQFYKVRQDYLIALQSSLSLVKAWIAQSETKLSDLPLSQWKNGKQQQELPHRSSTNNDDIVVDCILRV